MPENQEPILIGAAWPYANGSLHLGQLASLIPGDVLARYYRSAGHPVLFVSGTDAHGTPVVLAADKEGVPTSEFVERYHEEYVDNFNEMGFTFDNFFTTEDEFHYEVAQDVFATLLENGHLEKKSQKLPYSVEADKFLPDRYVEGECPHCGFEEARGDQCDECGRILDPEDLIDPISVLDDKAPEFRETEHYFLTLSELTEELEEWVETQDNWRDNAKNFTLGLLEDGLPDRAVTRDIDWGVPVPVEDEEFESKKIYVWFEAVSGYLSASKKWAEDNDGEWEDFWQEEDTYHYYVHGKDNIAFHTIIWPAMLKGYGGLNLPNSIVSSEYLNLEDKQFSTSRDWAVWVPNMLDKFHPDAIRFWLVARGPETQDANFTWQGFQDTINKDLAGVVGNLIHRTFSFIHNNFPEGVEKGELEDKDLDLLHLIEDTFAEVGELIRTSQFRKAVDKILRLADEGNRYLEDTAPWEKIDEDEERAEAALWVSAQMAYNLATLLSPVTPHISEKVYKDLGQDSDFDWVYEEIEEVQFDDEPEPPVELIPDEVVEAAEEELKE